MSTDHKTKGHFASPDKVRETAPDEAEPTA
jgi:hypothetical protein